MTYQKSSSFVLICAFISACVTMAGGAPNNPLAQAARVVERGENHRIWEQVHAITNDVKGAAQLQFLTNRYTELGAGLSYRQRDGSWADSHAEVTLTADGGAEAKKLPHKVHFAPDINTVAAIRMTLPDGKLMTSTPRGLYLYDTSSKERLIVGVITNSTGVIVPPNLVVYSNCFVGFDADLILRVTPAGLEQDIAIRESLDWIPLAELGFDPKSTVLEAWTEFYAAPKPVKKKNSIRARRVKGAEAAELSDDKLDFGSVIMRPGRAYSTRDANPQVGLAGHGNEPGSIPVGKAWLDAGDRRFLIESVRWPEILPHFEGLQKGSAVTNAAFRPDRRSAPAAIPEIPPALMAQVSNDRMLVAQHASANVPAFILDYATVNGYYPSYVFAPDQTYYISGGVYIDNAVFYGGSVIKLASIGNYAGIYVANSARFETGPGRMVLFTGKDDNSVGEWISGSSGNPLADYYGNPALSFEYDAQSVDMKYVRFSHVGQAVQFYNALRENRVRHCQFVRGLYGILSAENSLTLHNVLLNDFDTYFAGYSFSAYGEHLTVHGGWIVGDDWGDASLTLVNSLIIGPDLGWMTINLPSPSVAISPEPAQPVFQTMGFGAHYLAANSPYRGIGNPNINLELREALKQKTTRPPLGLPGGSLVNVTLAPHVLRNDGAQPDLGYSYDVLDYQGGGLYMQSGSTLLLTNGVSVSLNAGAISWGIRLMSGTKLISEGTPVKPNRLVEMRSVQEQYGGWVYPGFSSIYCEYAPGAYPQIQLRFTELLGRAGLNWHIYRNGGLASIALRDSEVFGGGITGLFTDAGVHNVDLINNLFEWSKIIIEANGGTRLSVEHNTFTNGQIRFIGQNSSYSRFRDNLVDKVNVSVSPLFAITGNGYYVTPALPGSPPQHTLISPVNYQHGPLGDFYLPSGSSPLLSGGSQTPSASGLFHYTTRVTQEKEGSKPDPMVNGRVDVGYHYVAVSSPNVAVGKAATQSTTDYGGPASRAVDGNISGDWFNASVSHTAYEEEPWWQVDLGAVTSISDVRIWNRTDCCGERLSNFYVFVSDNPFQYADVSSTLAQPGVSSHLVSGPAGTLAVLTIARTARYVRVQLTGADYLSLAEVQVFAPYSPIDSDSDGLADYVEDRNGNGIVDAGESSFSNPDTDGDIMPDGWEIAYGLNPLSSADATADPDGDLLNNRAEYLAKTHPFVPDIGYIPNNKNGQPWPTTVPISPPNLGASTQEREYRFDFAGVTSSRPNAGVARALAERIDDVLIAAVLNRSQWAAYAALAPFPTGGDVHNITDPANTANYIRDTAFPTHTVFMDIYFDTESDHLCYTHTAECRMRRRFEDTDRWLRFMSGDTSPVDPDLNNRIEFMSKVDRIFFQDKPGYSEVTESRNRDRIPHLPATQIQSRINDYQDGRWPADLQLQNGTLSGDAGMVCNAAWKIREYLLRTPPPPQAPAILGTDILKLRPRLIIVAERRRQHLELPNLKLSFVPNVVLDGVFIISIDSSHVYEAGPLLAYMQDPNNIAIPESVGSFVTVDVEFERDTSDTLDDFINVTPPRADRANLITLRNAFLQDLGTLINLLEAEFNNKPLDLTEFYTIKGASAMVDLRTHAQVLKVNQQLPSGVHTRVQGKIGSGLSFNGNGYVSYVAQAQSAAATVAVDPNSVFVLTEFQTRDTDNVNAILDPDEVFTDPNNPDLAQAREDWIEIQNVTDTAQDLDGWKLRDSNNNNLWTFPNGISVPAGGCLIVFADEENPTDADPPLHANFRLSGNGEYLALLAPDDTVATSYGTVATPPSVPDSEYDVSYGIEWNGTTWVEGLFNASPGRPNQGIYRRRPLNLGSADFTISLWLKTSSTSVGILSRSDTDTTLEVGEKQLYLDANGRVRYVGMTGVIAGTSAVNNNAWHHIAITFTVAGNVSAVYVDGVNNTDLPNTTYTATPDALALRLYLGLAASQGLANFSGVLDEVAIWGRALSATEIAAINQAGLQGSGVDTRGQLPSELLFHASMDLFLDPGPEGSTKYKKAFDLLP